MYLQIDLKHVSGGAFFHASGKKRPDSYRFDRVKGQEHIHRLIVKASEMDAVLEDLGLRLQQADIPVLIKVVIEDSDRDSAGTVEALRAEQKVLEEKVAQLTSDLDAARRTREPKSGDKQRITDEQLRLLVERDELVAVLGHYAEETDPTPLSVLQRLAAAYKVTEPEKADEPPVDQKARRKALTKLGKKPLRKKLKEMKLTVEGDANIATMVDAILRAEAAAK